MGVHDPETLHPVGVCILRHAVLFACSLRGSGDVASATGEGLSEGSWLHSPVQMSGSISGVCIRPLDQHREQERGRLWFPVCRLYGRNQQRALPVADQTASAHVIFPEVAGLAQPLWSYHFRKSRSPPKPELSPESLTFGDQGEIVVVLQEEQKLSSGARSPHRYTESGFAPRPWYSALQ